MNTQCTCMASPLYEYAHVSSYDPNEWFYNHNQGVYSDSNTTSQKSQPLE